jgi:hypothetical protein
VRAVPKSVLPSTPPKLQFVGLSASGKEPIASLGDEEQSLGVERQPVRMVARRAERDRWPLPVVAQAHPSAARLGHAQAAMQSTSTVRGVGTPASVNGYTLFAAHGKTYVIDMSGQVVAGREILAPQPRRDVRRRRDEREQGPRAARREPPGPPEGRDGR